MRKPPTVSVVIITHNMADLVEKAIDSVLAQTYTDSELIVVDDGSTDDTRERLSARSELRYLPIENSGRGPARNHGIRASQGRWVAFLDSDDVWYPEKLEMQMRVALDPRFKGAGLICADYDEIDMEGRFLKAVGTRGGFPIFTKCGFDVPDVYGRRERIDGLDVYSELKLPVFFHGNCVLPSTSLARKKMIDELGEFKNVLGEDPEVFLRWATGYDFVYIDKPLIGYRVGRPDQHTAPYKLEKLVAYDIEMRHEHIEQHPDFAAAHPEAVKQVFSEQHARMALFQAYRGDVRTARESLRTAKTHAPLKAKYKKLDLLLKLQSFLVSALIKLRRGFTS